MTSAPGVPDPRIRIALRDGRIAIERTPVNVASVLCGRPLEEALHQIAILLPVCGAAQEIAARRAVEAARGEVEGEARAERASLLHGEQIEAGAWRLAIDWPRVLGTEPDTAAFKRVRDAQNFADRADAGRAFLPRFEAVATWDDVWTWARDRHCGAATLLAMARERDSAATPATLLSGDELVRRAFNCLMSGGTVTDAAEVGPLAMARHPLVASAPALTVSHRLAAQLLDFVALLDERLAPEDGPNAWSAPGRCGVGRAMTARGPLFHRVVLNAEETSARAWEVLAPTDWHFAPTGPLAGMVTNETVLPFLILSFDPCAPWSIAETREVAHV